MVTGGGQSGHQTLSRISLFLSAGRAIQRVNVLLVDACAMKRSFIMILIILSLTKTFPQLAVPVFNVVFIGPPVSQEFHALINIEPVRRDTPNSHLAGFSILWLPSIKLHFPGAISANITGRPISIESSLESSMDEYLVKSSTATSSEVISCGWSEYIRSFS